MPNDSDLLHALITELHEAVRARGWRGEDLLDLANVIAARGSVPPAGTLGPLTARLRAANGAKVADVATMAGEALAAATKRVDLVARASGRARSATKSNSAGVTAEDLLSIKVAIRDGAAFDRLEPAAVVDYLGARGWRKGSDRRHNGIAPDAPALGSEWRKGKSFILVPAAHVADRTLRMAEVVSSLAILEKRSELLVYRDLLNASLHA